MEGNKKYSIGEFSKVVGLTSYTLRYYEREGLIIPNRDKNGRRYYTEQDISWIGFLLHLKGTGMSMNEIEEYIKLRAQGDSTIEQRKDLLKRVRKNSLSQIDEMKMHLKVLSHKIDWYEGKLDHTISDSEGFSEYLKRFE
ncbi:MerR family transcriptional regulator [Fructilactobacillus fructivorans]|uniref:MerR family transcriptional regulator n=1 Tax=Fructilactobacillus fructivorans TaxID=1614 RepID=A0AAE6TX49_9LACO|nr:MerR family transcriptional regulator [Fructilactobacillus fructivorans]KRK56892.1 transcriptional regulator [Fructilactobacillus fructivorans]KRN13171.1 transcriptional regulator [Fructilactobacillus fructivorans]KRN41244.1 transcriptional regulator [Fructilactobacillus fructivorans]KRN43059.1 transcriptional regulator [Fructilactobacillus fructivorans]QFX93252.1 MerR family transcriptional regulator [Fructilactobacillus fructivorans]